MAVSVCLGVSENPSLSGKHKVDRMRKGRAAGEVCSLELCITIIYLQKLRQIKYSSGRDDRGVEKGEIKSNLFVSSDFGMLRMGCVMCKS